MAISSRLGAGCPTEGVCLTVKDGDTRAVRFDSQPWKRIDFYAVADDARTFSAECVSREISRQSAFQESCDGASATFRARFRLHLYKEWTVECFLRPKCVCMI
ncbi:hypothetical protein ACLOJK_012677 [Asimina triloba]